MKTVSNIILEEIIKQSLIELDVKKPNTDNKDNKKTNTNVKITDGERIANDIIGSTSWYNDREDDLIAAVKRIKNSSEFWAVNRKIKQKTRLSFSEFIFNKILDSDEWDNIYPIIKHLSKIFPESQWGNKEQPQPVYAFLSKTTNAAIYLRRKDKTLYDKFLQGPLDTTNTTIKSKTMFDKLIAGAQSLGNVGLAVAGLAMIICYRKKKGVFCGLGNKLLGIGDGSGKPDIINDIKMYEKVFKIYAKTNRTELINAINGLKNEGLITEQELKLLTAEIKSLSKADLDRAKIYHILKRFKQIGTLSKGDTNLILQGISDLETRKLLAPYLQAYEDFKLGNTNVKIKRPNSEPNPIDIKPAKLIARDIKPKLITRYPKSEVSLNDIEKIYNIFNESNPSGAWGFGENPSKFERDFAKLVQKYELGQAKKLTSKWETKTWNKYKDKWKAVQEIVYQNNELPVNLKLINNMINKIKTGKASIPEFYIKSETFPSWNQWKYDNYIKGGGTTDSYLNYITQKYIWNNLRRNNATSKPNISYVIPKPSWMK